MRYLIIFLFLFSLDAKSADDPKFKKFYKENIAPIAKKFKDTCYKNNLKFTFCLTGTDNNKKVGKIRRIVENGTGETIKNTILDPNFLTLNERRYIDIYYALLKWPKIKSSKAEKFIIQYSEEVIAKAIKREKEFIKDHVVFNEKTLDHIKKDHAKIYNKLINSNKINELYQLHKKDTQDSFAENVKFYKFTENKFKQKFTTILGREKRLASMSPQERSEYLCINTFNYKKGTSNFNDCRFKLYAADMELEKLKLEQKLEETRLETIKAQIDAARNEKERKRLARLHNEKLKLIMAIALNASKKAQKASRDVAFSNYKSSSDKLFGSKSNDTRIENRAPRNCYNVGGFLNCY